jgi:hypothetical protein
MGSQEGMTETPEFMTDYPGPNPLLAHLHDLAALPVPSPDLAAGGQVDATQPAVDAVDAVPSSGKHVPAVFGEAGAAPD